MGGVICLDNTAKQLRPAQHSHTESRRRGYKIVEMLQNFKRENCETDLKRCELRSEIN